MLRRFKSIAVRVVPLPLYQSGSEPVAFSASWEENPYVLPDNLLLEICSHVVPYSTQDAFNILCCVSYFIPLLYPDLYARGSLFVPSHIISVASPLYAHLTDSLRIHRYPENKGTEIHLKSSRATSFPCTKSAKHRLPRGPW